MMCKPKFMVNREKIKGLEEKLILANALVPKFLTIENGAEFILARYFGESTTVNSLSAKDALNVVAQQYSILEGHGGLGEYEEIRLMYLEDIKKRIEEGIALPLAVEKVTKGAHIPIVDGGGILPDSVLIEIIDNLGVKRQYSLDRIISG